MKKLTELPNIGKILLAKLHKIGMTNEQELRELGCEKTLLSIATTDTESVCLNMLYALEGAIQGIRWHHLGINRKQELKKFYQLNFYFSQIE